MTDTLTTGRITKRQHEKKQKRRKKNTGHKLPTLPSDAQITKRPLLRPAIPSPYSGPAQPKVIYVSAKTPFLSAVKRAEKLLRLGDKRLVQSATQLHKDNLQKKRRAGRREDEDDIVGIAREVEKKKQKGSDAEEEVVLKGTGKAISKVMELGLWFQQREDEYRVRLKTGSVGAVEDVQYEEEGEKTAQYEAEGEKDASAGAPEEAVAVTVTVTANEHVQDGSKKYMAKPMSKVVKRGERETDNGKKEITETRIRQLSVLEVYVSLR